MRELLCAALVLLGPVTSDFGNGADPGIPGCSGVTEVLTGPGIAHADRAVVPGGLYDLSVLAGTRTPGPATAVGLQFFDRDNAQVGRTYARWPSTDQPKRYNSYGMIAPPATATVRFFAVTDAEIHWGCAWLRVSAYDLTLEDVGDTFRITVTNTGGEPLTNLSLSLPECPDLDRTPFTLTKVEIRTCTSDATGEVTVTASGALYWNGALPDRSATITRPSPEPPAQELREPVRSPGRARPPPRQARLN